MLSKFFTTQVPLRVFTLFFFSYSSVILCFYVSTTTFVQILSLRVLPISSSRSCLSDALDPKSHSPLSIISDPSS